MWLMWKRRRCCDSLGQPWCCPGVDSVSLEPPLVHERVELLLWESTADQPLNTPALLLQGSRGESLGAAVPQGA